MAWLVLLCLASLLLNPANGLVEDNVVANKTCYYCGFEEPCPLDFKNHADSVRIIKCKKSCLKFDGWTPDAIKRVVVRDCGYYSDTVCGSGKLDSQATASGTVCHCTTEKCNGASNIFSSTNFNLIAVTTVILAKTISV